MATPLNVSASQAAQQKLQDPAESQKLGKTNARFDERMQSKAQSIQTVSQVSEAQKAEAAQRVTQAQKVEQVAKTQKAELKKVNANTGADTVRDQKQTADVMPKVEQYLEQLNHNSSKIDDLIKRLGDGRVKLDQRELIKMQVQVYGYSMELDLTGKVVEKATSGLKDTLKTQV